MQETHRISVGEPWNYQGPHGQNVILGCILKRISGSCIIFQSSKILEFDGISGDKIILFPRYKKETFTADFDRTTVNCGLLKVEDFEELDEKALEENSLFIVIGGLERVSL